MNWLQAIGAMVRGDVLDAEYRDLTPATMDYRAASIVGDNIVRWTADQPQWRAYNTGEFDSLGYRASALIFRATQVISSLAAVPPLKVYQHVDDSDDEIPDHDLRQVLSFPNDRMGGTRLMSWIVLNMLVTNFTVIEKERDQYGNVIGLWPLRSDWIRPIPRNNAPPDWEYRVPGHERPFLLEATEVIPITYADTPTLDITGIGPMVTIWKELQVQTSLRDYIKAFFDRGGMPLYIAIPEFEHGFVKQWDSTAKVDAFREGWRQRRAASDDPVDVIPAVKDIKALGFDMRQLTFDNLKRSVEATILTAFGVPGSLVFTEGGWDNATFNNVEAAERSFYTNTMVPLWARIDDALTRHLLPEFETDSSYHIEFDTSSISALQEDMTQNRADAATLFRDQVISRHRAQELAGIEKHGDDAFYVSMPSLPSQDTEPDDAPDPGAEDDDLEVPGERSAPPRYEKRGEHLYANVAVFSQDEQRQIRSIASGSKTAMNRLAVMLAPKMQRFFRSQKTRVLAGYGERSTDGAPEVREFYDPIDWLLEDQALSSEMRDWWEDVVKASADVLMEAGFASTWDISNPHIQDLFNVLSRQVVGINETTRRAIETIVREELIVGSSNEEIARRLTGLFDDTYRNRYVTVARTEARHAFNLASQAQYQASGEVSNVIMHDGNQCQSSKPGSDGLTCGQRNGMIVHVSAMSRHDAGEHPQGTLSFAPILDRPLGE